MDLRVAIREQASFILDFYGRIDRGEGNGVVSPLSISMALAIAASGAKGETLEQVCSVLRLPKGSDMHDFAQQMHAVLLVDASAAGGPALSIANGVWIEKAVKLSAEYEKNVREKYGAEAKSVDFQSKAEESRKLINSWVSDKTKGKIEELLPPEALDSQTKLLLANALYFKGAWLKPFESSETQKDGTFYLANGSQVKVPMMTSSTKKYIRNHGKYKVLRLPYQSGSDLRKFSMYFLLPSERNGLEEMTKALLNSTQLLEDSFSHIQEVQVGKFLLPKFKITKAIDAADLLQKMGLVLPFSDNADFSGMLEDAAMSKALYISDVFHKAFVEVNEEGTEAAAATGVAVSLRSLPLNPPEDFVADHPFMFLIREDATGIILFLGHVNNPAA